MCWGPHSWSWRAAGCAGVLTPGPGGLQGVLASVVTQHLINQVIHLTWFLGSESVADIQTKTSVGALPG